MVIKHGRHRGQASLIEGVLAALVILAAAGAIVAFVPGVALIDGEQVDVSTDIRSPIIGSPADYPDRPAPAQIGQSDRLILRETVGSTVAERRTQIHQLVRAWDPDDSEFQQTTATEFYTDRRELPGDIATAFPESVAIPTADGRVTKVPINMIVEASYPTVSEENTIGEGVQLIARFGDGTIENPEPVPASKIDEGPVSRVTMTIPLSQTDSLFEMDSTIGEADFYAPCVASEDISETPAASETACTVIELTVTAWIGDREP